MKTYGAEKVYKLQALTRRNMRAALCHHHDRDVIWLWSHDVIRHVTIRLHLAANRLYPLV